MGIEMAYTPEIGRRFWFELDEATLHSADFMNTVVRAGAAGAQNVYKNTRGAGTYPAAFRNRFLPQRADWVTIADLQRGLIGQFL
jgi:hypothetical protein